MCSGYDTQLARKNLIVNKNTILFGRKVTLTHKNILVKNECGSVFRDFGNRRQENEAYKG